MFLGFTKNSDPSLEQGRKFNNILKTFDNMVGPQLALIEQGSERVMEGLENAGQEKLQSITDAELKKLNDLENSFNTALNQYKSQFRSYLTDLSNKTNAPATSYKNQVITDSQGSKWWVNNMGYARKFSTDAWAKRSPSCPISQTGTINSASFSSFPTGVNMGIGERCGPVGINVQSSAGGGTAWITPNGVKHPYTNLRDRNKNCPGSVSAGNTLTPTEYGAMTTGAQWTSADSCNLLASSDKYSQVQALNNKLISLSNEMNAQVQIIVKRDNIVSGETSARKKALIAQAKILDIEREKIQQAATSIITSQGVLENKRLVAGSVNIHYFVWLLAFVTLGGIAVKRVLKS